MGMGIGKGVGGKEVGATGSLAVTAPHLESSGKKQLKHRAVQTTVHDHEWESTRPSLQSVLYVALRRLMAASWADRRLAESIHLDTWSGNPSTKPSAQGEGSCVARFFFALAIRATTSS